MKLEQLSIGQECKISAGLDIYGKRRFKRVIIEHINPDAEPAYPGVVSVTVSDINNANWKTSVLPSQLMEVNK